MQEELLEGPRSRKRRLIFKLPILTGIACTCVASLIGQRIAEDPPLWVLIFSLLCAGFAGDRFGAWLVLLFSANAPLGRLVGSGDEQSGITSGAWDGFVPANESTLRAALLAVCYMDRRGLTIWRNGAQLQIENESPFWRMTIISPDERRTFYAVSHFSPYAGKSAKQETSWRNISKKPPGDEIEDQKTFVTALAFLAGERSSQVHWFESEWQ